TVLIGGHEPSAVWRDGKIARCLASGRSDAEKGEPPGLFVAAELRDAVVSPVGTIDKTSIGMDGDFSGCALSPISGWQCAHGLPCGQDAGFGVEGGDGDGAEELIDHIKVFSILGEHGMPRS